jgi:hypothetical protein
MEEKEIPKEDEEKSKKEQLKKAAKQQESIESIDNRNASNFQFKQKYAFTRGGKTKRN